MQPRLGLIGVTGYGNVHLSAAAQFHREGRARLVAYADVSPAAPEAVADAHPEPVTAYTSYLDMLDREQLDIVVVAAPIHLHSEMLEAAFTREIATLVEKPPVVRIQDLDRLIGLQRTARIPCQVGFQTSATPAMTALLDAVVAGAFGRIHSIGSVGRWQRADSYYARAAWAGRLIHDGRHVLDGTLTNPFAHALMNALIVAGGGHPTTPTSVQAELYHCRDIDGDDTASVRIETSAGATLLLATTLCAEEPVDPYVFVDGEAGSARLYYTRGRLDSDVTGPVDTRPDRGALLGNLIDVVCGDTDQLLCPLDATRGFVLTIDGMYESAGSPRAISGSAWHATDPDDRIVQLSGIDEIIDRCAHEGLLFSEAGADWATSTKQIAMDGYERFDLSTD